MTEHIFPHDQNNFPLLPAGAIGLLLLAKKTGDANRHHMFFYESRFKKDRVLRRLRDNCLTSVWIGRDPHLMLHQHFHSSAVPDRCVAQAFLEEAEVVESAVRKLKIIGCIASSRTSRRAESRSLALQEEVRADIEQFADFQVMPGFMRDMISSGVEALHAQALATSSLQSQGRRS